MESLVKMTLILAFLGTSLSGCYYDNVVELYPTTCNTSSVTYSGFVKPYVVAGCSCHINGSQSGQVNLNTYTDLKKYISNDLFIKSIKHESGVSAMPPSTIKTSSCEISKLEAWIAAGALEN